MKIALLLAAACCGTLTLSAASVRADDFNRIEMDPSMLTEADSPWPSSNVIR